MVVLLSPSKPNSDECRGAYRILCRAHASAGFFLRIFLSIRKTRNAKGAPTVEEQDLLRAMLVFAAAGLDVMLKQLIRDALPSVIDREPSAARRFTKYAAQRINKGGEFDSQFVAKLLTDKQETRTQLLDHLVVNLTSGSLQSTDQLFRVASFFDIPAKAISEEPGRLREAFVARNAIVHEMDIDMNQQNKNRRQRSQASTVEFTNRILDVSATFLSGVDRRLSESIDLEGG